MTIQDDKTQPLEISEAQDEPHFFGFHGLDVYGEYPGNYYAHPHLMGFVVTGNNAIRLIVLPLIIRMNKTRR